MKNSNKDKKKNAAKWGEKPREVDEQLQPENEPSRPIALEEATLQLVPSLKFKGENTTLSKFRYQTRQWYQRSFKLPIAPWIISKNAAVCRKPLKKKESFQHFLSDSTNFSRNQRNGLKLTDKFSHRRVSTTSRFGGYKTV